MCFFHDLYDLNVIFFLQSWILYKNPCRKTNLNFYKIREISTEKWVSKVCHRLAKRKNSTEIGIYMIFDQLVQAQKQFVAVSRSFCSKMIVQSHPEKNFPKSLIFNPIFNDFTACHVCVAVHLIWNAVHKGQNAFFQKQHTNKGMDEKKINKNLKNCPKSPRFTVCNK